MPIETAKDWSAGSFNGPKVENQDYVVFTQSGDYADIERKGVLMVACDGGESQKCGARASRIASLKVMDVYYSQTATDTAHALRTAVTQSHQLVQAEARGRECNGMTTTIAAVVVFGEMVYAAWCGNTRIYVVHSGKLTQLNETAMHISNEGISETKFLLDPSDRVVMLTDGIFGVLDDPKILRTLKKNRAPEQAVDALIKAALDGGTEDNVSVAICNLDKPGVAAANRNPLPIGRILSMLMLLALAVGSIYLIASGQLPEIGKVFSSSQQGATATAQDIIQRATAFAVAQTPPTPTVTQTPVPTETPIPTETPELTSTPLPSLTPQATDTPEPTLTPLPTNTATRRPLPPPTRVVIVTLPPLPSATLVPVVQTVEPTRAPDTGGNPQPQPQPQPQPPTSPPAEPTSPPVEPTSPPSPPTSPPAPPTNPPPPANL